MKSKSSKWIALCGLALASPLQATDHGYPTMNTIGRYFGVGWSHHSYHSHVNGRFDLIDQRHPASDYYSRTLDFPYSPYYSHYPTGGSATQPAASYWNPPVGTNSSPIILSPTLAPPPVETSKKDPGTNQKAKPEEVPSESSSEGSERVKKIQTPPIKPKAPLPKPASPPPDWLRPFLDSDQDGSGVEVEDDDSELIELQPSPSDRSGSKGSLPRSASLPGSIINRYKIQ